jgi:YrbI family 3-deoxy-D-manno-octulosonate 8-phosphate phosphatase
VTADKIKLLVLDFDGVLTDNRVYVSDDGKESVCCSRADSLGLDRIKKRIRATVLSKETSPVVAARCKKLGIGCLQGMDDKLSVLMDFATTLPMMAYMGNDINDLECMEAVGISACPADAHPDCQQAASFISKYNGGNGAVREFCDWLIREEKA